MKTSRYNPFLGPIELFFVFGASYEANQVTEISPAYNSTNKFKNYKSALGMRQKYPRGNSRMPTNFHHLRAAIQLYAQLDRTHRVLQHTRVSQ